MGGATILAGVVMHPPPFYNFSVLYDNINKFTKSLQQNKLRNKSRLENKLNIERGLWNNCQEMFKCLRVASASIFDEYNKQIVLA